jgi:hypothetical protein
MAAPTDVSLTVSDTDGEAPLAVAVTPHAVDPDDTATPSVTIAWGDRTPASIVDAGTAAAHVYQSPGQYTISARAAIGADTTDADDVVVTVAAPNAFPALDSPGGVCVPWVTLETVGLPAGFDDPTLAQAAIDAATRWLNDATVNRWSGPCTAFVRPDTGTDRLCDPATARLRSGPIDLSTWLTAPIRSVVEVRVDGVAVDAKWYYLNGNRLYASTGFDDADSPLIPWPTQNVDRQPGAADTWDVTVVHGSGPPEGLVDAAKRLAGEIIKQRCGDASCALPENVTSVSRDSVTITFTPPLPGRTGVRYIDDQVSLYGPDGYGRSPRRMYDPAAPTSAQVNRYL